MSDITKCLGIDCPLKDKCKRYLAKTNKYYQSYFIGSPYDKEKKECSEFWEFKTN